MKKILTDTEIASRFLSLRTVYDLSLLMGVHYEDLWLSAEKPFYRTFEIKKKRGGYRQIEAPQGKLKYIQKQINFYLQKVYTTNIASEHSHGFIKKGTDTEAKNIRSNAQLHIGKKNVLNIDLKDFFHSVSASRVRYMFMSTPFDFERELATSLALLCSFNKRLPMGAPTSPVLSNFATTELDKVLNAFANKKRLVYSRFADDLTFSSNDTITEKTTAEIKMLIAGEGFWINRSKCRLQKQTNRQSVTGIKVNERLNIDRTYIRNIRAALHDVEENGIYNAAQKYYQKNNLRATTEYTFILSLKGKINFVGFVRGKEDDLYKKLKSKFAMLFEAGLLKMPRGF